MTERRHERVRPSFAAANSSRSRERRVPFGATPIARTCTALRGYGKKEKTNKPWIRRVALLEWWVLNFTFARLFPFLTGARSKAAGLFIVERAASRPRLPLNAAAKGEALMTPGKPPAVVPLSQSASSPPALNERTSPLRFMFVLFTARCRFMGLEKSSEFGWLSARCPPNDVLSFFFVWALSRCVTA